MGEERQAQAQHHFHNKGTGRAQPLQHSRDFRSAPRLESLGLRDVDLDHAAVHLEAVQSFARRVGGLLGAEGHEAKAAAPERLFALGQVLAVLDFAKLREDFVQCFWEGGGSQGEQATGGARAVSVRVKAKVSAANHRTYTHDWRGSPYQFGGQMCIWPHIFTIVNPTISLLFEVPREREKKGCRRGVAPRIYRRWWRSRGCQRTRGGPWCRREAREECAARAWDGLWTLPWTRRSPRLCCGPPLQVRPEPLPLPWPRRKSSWSQSLDSKRKGQRTLGTKKIRQRCIGACSA